MLNIYGEMLEVPSDWESPDFKNHGRVHEWKNYIGPELRIVWDSLSPETRKVAAYLAEGRAGAEEWD